MAYQCSPKSNRSNLKYPFDWLYVLFDFLPISFKKPRTFGYLSVPFNWIWNTYLDFLNYRCRTLFYCAIDGRTIVLERGLNLMFDSINRQIYIENTYSNFETMYIYGRGETLPTGDESYLYNRDETIPVGGNQEYIFNKTEVDNNFDFIVWIPFALAAALNLNYVRAIIDSYKFMGTTYTIKTF